jgi:hypothetical protein
VLLYQLQKLCSATRYENMDIWNKGGGGDICMICSEGTKCYGQVSRSPASYLEGLVSDFSPQTGYPD